MRPIVYLLLLLLLSVAPVGCGADAPRDQPSMQEPAPAGVDTANSSQEAVRPTVYACDDPDGGTFRFIVQTRPDEITLRLPRRFDRPALVVPRVQAASGVKYAVGGVVVWTKGDEALLEVDGRTFSGCREDVRAATWADAALRGVDFRAVGNEPGWYLELYEGDRMHLVYAYGEREASTPAPSPEVDAEGRTVYLAETEAHDLKVVIEEAPCTDSMSGESFDAAVTVAIDGATLRGCGRALQDVP